MSTKIWVARRFPVSRINDFIDFCEETITQRVVEHIMKYMGLLKDTYGLLEKRVKAHQKFCSENNDECPEWHIRNCRFKAYMEGATEAAKSLQRTTIFDIECGLNMWFYRGKVYAIPWGDFSNGIDWPEWAEDYHYQNQTDEPEGLKPGEFARRGTMWDKVCLDDWNTRRMSHEIICLREGQSFESSIKLERLIVPEMSKAWSGKAGTKVSVADICDV